MSYFSTSHIAPFSCQPWKGCLLDVSLGGGSRVGSVSHPCSSTSKACLVLHQPEVVVALQRSKTASVRTIGESVVYSSSPPAPSGAPTAPSAALGKAGLAAWGRNSLRDRLGPAARARGSQEVLSSLPLPSRSGGGWSYAPEVFLPPPACSEHGGGLGDGAAIFRYF